MAKSFIQNNISQTVSAKQEQKISAQLLKGLEIIQKPNTELAKVIYKEIEQNPVLEISNKQINDDFVSYEKLTDINVSEDDFYDQDGDLNNDKIEDSEYYEQLYDNPSKNIKEQADDTNVTDEKNDSVSKEQDDFVDNFENNNYSSQDTFTKNNNHSDDDFLKQTLIENNSYDNNLREHLLEQLKFIEINKAEYAICFYIISSLDDKGFLSQTKEEIFEQIKSNTSNIQRTTFDKAINIVQSLDPDGVGAENIRECLLIQLSIKNETLVREDLEALTEWRIIYDEFENLSKKGYEKIAKNLNISKEDIEKALEEIRFLNPNPAINFQKYLGQFYVKPDFEIIEEGEKLKVIFNEKYIPKVEINNYYKDVLFKDNIKPNIKKYLKDKLNSGKFFINQINKRKQTLLKLLSFIIDQQMDFFKKGKSHLKPLRLKDASEELNLNESTISRAINSKFVKTKWGVVPLKLFFSSGISHNKKSNFSEAEYNNLSKEAIKEVIKNIINDTKYSSKRLSDNAIVQILAKKNIKISRRAVNKYRNELGILTSNLR